MTIAVTISCGMTIATVTGVLCHYQQWQATSADSWRWCSCSCAKLAPDGQQQLRNGECGMFFNWLLTI